MAMTRASLTFHRLCSCVNLSRICMPYAEKRLELYDPGFRATLAAKQESSLASQILLGCPHTAFGENSILSVPETSDGPNNEHPTPQMRQIAAFAGQTAELSPGISRQDRPYSCIFFCQEASDLCLGARVCLYLHNVFLYLCDPLLNSLLILSKYVILLGPAPILRVVYGSSNLAFRYG